jgi:Domain of Unknown Function (DUF1259)
MLATGSQAGLAQAFDWTVADRALGATGAPTPFQAPPPVALGAFELDTAAFATALGVAGKVNGGVYQVSVPRPEVIHDAGEEIPPSMGVATSINVQPTTSGHAVATGDFALLPAEVNPVIRALRANGISVTALHSHLMMDDPHVLFMHFWGDDETLKLAHGLRAALDATAMVPGRKK